MTIELLKFSKIIDIKTYNILYLNVILKMALNVQLGKQNVKVNLL